MTTFEIIAPNSGNFLLKPVIRVAATSDWLTDFEHVQSESLVAATPQPVAATGSCVFTRSTVLLAFLQRWNCGDSVARVNRPYESPCERRYNN